MSHLCYHRDSVLVAVDNWSYANQGVWDEHEAKRQAHVITVEARFDANVKLASTADGRPTLLYPTLPYPTLPYPALRFRV